MCLSRKLNRFNYVTPSVSLIYVQFETSISRMAVRQAVDPFN